MKIKIILLENKKGLLNLGEFSNPLFIDPSPPTPQRVIRHKLAKFPEQTVFTSQVIQ